jgi:acetyl esterase/lipase
MKQSFVRQLCLALCMVLALGGVNASAEISITPDVVYGHKDGMALTYDVLKPEKHNGAAIIFMVSGGWFSRYSAPENSAKQFSDMLDAGYAVYTVRHGSAPRYKVPEAVADVENAIDHIYANAGDHGVDPGRLGVFGGSAGGHLSLMLGCATGPVGEEPDADAKAGKGRVAAVVAYFPPVDLRSIVGPNERFPALEFEQDDAAYVSPILHVTPDDPPTLLIHGDKDELVPILTSETIYAAFKENNVTTDFITIPGAGHGFRGEDATVAMKAVIDWFDEHLGE